MKQMSIILNLGLVFSLGMFPLLMKAHADLESGQTSQNVQTLIASPTLNNSSKPFYFYNNYEGVIKKWDKKSLTDVYPVINSSNIKRIVWSPDGNKALLEVENSKSIKDSNKLYSPERADNSQNWWVVDLKSTKSTLLDTQINLAGWLNNDEIVYLFNQTYVSKAPLSNLSQFKSLAINTSDRTIVKNVSPFLVNKYTVFPLNKGFYLIEPNTGKVVFYDIPGTIQKITASPFNSNILVILSDQGPFLFNTDRKALEPISHDTPIRDIEAFDKDTLLLLTSAKLVSFNMGSGLSKEIVIPNFHEGIVNVYSTGIPQDILLVNQESIYHYNNKNLEQIYRINQVKGDFDIGYNKSANSYSPSFVFTIVLLSFIVGFIGIGSFVIYRKIHYNAGN